MSLHSQLSPRMTPNRSIPDFLAFKRICRFRADISRSHCSRNWAKIFFLYRRAIGAQDLPGGADRRRVERGLFFRPDASDWASPPIQRSMSGGVAQPRARTGWASAKPSQRGSRATDYPARILHHALQKGHRKSRQPGCPPRVRLHPLETPGA